MFGYNDISINVKEYIYNLHQSDGHKLSDYLFFVISLFINNMIDEENEGKFFKKKRYFDLKKEKMNTTS